MSNNTQLQRLCEGVLVWNAWRDEHPAAKPDLAEADLVGANLIRRNLIKADLRGARLAGACLTEANLSGANLAGADLAGANLNGAVLLGARLEGASLAEANLMGACLIGANLTGASLVKACLSGTYLNGANLRQATLGWTAFSDNDLSRTKGLESVVHAGPSIIGMLTVINSKGKIPAAFLRGCGAPESFIERAREALRQPLDYHSCFIRYSSHDQAFAERLYRDLQSHGVRCWFAPADGPEGRSAGARVERALRSFDKLVMVLSAHSAAADWARTEMANALAKESDQQRPVLFPVRVDDAASPAPARSMPRSPRLADFRGWRRQAAYRQAFTRLLDELKAPVLCAS
jgi:uncharacterized protein YjbI with pentapeptide repeats